MDDQQQLGEPTFDPYHPDCPSRQMVDRIGDKWTVLVVGVLSEGPARYRDLSGRVAGISPKMLSQTLKGLERDGLITRRAYAEVPPRVEYELTPAGASLRPVLLDLERWAREHMPEVLRARAAHDAGQGSPDHTPGQVPDRVT
ncbi:winged helix-turn-helix transcriptional regulator [Pseudokineococcus marinus]|uniref:Helix-turn-helix transcriptional regulator n=1 Tax=Pseudokineococcus marinus TaxID=351215 RepID=A0A849BLA6_9ACTN|nr:helix-turn-helix domain-containing protein [Pseudokineococcus marinus]NNH21857.1 helix-turn-helix transcriptional regulator [Pseudokineococcus marinus]